MHKLGRGHRDKLQQFITITGASEKIALQALKASDWHLEGAFDFFYNQPQLKTFTDSRHLEELYNRYKDAYVDMILADGITLLCNDIQVTVSECKLKFLDSFIFIVYIYSPVCNHRVCCKDVNSTCKLQALIPEILFGI